MNVVWSNRALQSLANIHSYISAESPDAANSTIDGILKRGDQLAEFPKIGRIVERYKRPGIRELVEAPYRILYALVTLAWTWNYLKDANRVAAAALQQDIDAPDFELALPMRAEPRYIGKRNNTAADFS